MEQEIRNVLLAVTDSLITVAHTAYYGHEMAQGCYQLLVDQSDNPREIPARFRAALHGAGKLTQERDELLAKLHELRQTLTSL